VSWRFLAPVRPGDVITASATELVARADKPVTTLATRVINQDGVVVLDGTAVVWRDPVVAAHQPRARVKRTRRNTPTENTHRKAPS
jgi:hypothetical protein